RRPSAAVLGAKNAAAKCRLCKRSEAGRGGGPSPPPSRHLDVLPEAGTPGEPPKLGARMVVAPGGARVTRAGDHHVVALDGVRAGVIGFRLRRLPQPLAANRGAREILVAVPLDDVVALGDHAAVDCCLHARILHSRRSLLERELYRVAAEPAAPVVGA